MSSSVRPGNTSVGVDELRKAGLEFGPEMAIAPDVVRFDTATELGSETNAPEPKDALAPSVHAEGVSPSSQFSPGVHAAPLAPFHV